MPLSESAITAALHQAHLGLLVELRSLKAAVSPASNQRIIDLLSRLRTAHWQVSEHFRYEEQNGYMETIRKREPRLERAIHKLAEDHQKLQWSLDLLIEGAEVLARSETELREGIREWVSQIRRHETQENELLQDAFNLDIGAED